MSPGSPPPSHIPETGADSDPINFGYNSSDETAESDAILRYSLAPAVLADSKSPSISDITHRIVRLRNTVISPRYRI